MNQPFRIRPADSEDTLIIGEILVETWRATFRGIIDDAYLDGMSEEDQAIRHAIVDGRVHRGRGRRRRRPRVTTAVMVGSPGLPRRGFHPTSPAIAVSRRRRSP